MHQVCV